MTCALCMCLAPELIRANRSQTSRNLGFFKVALLGPGEGCAYAVAVDGIVLVVSSLKDVVRITFQTPSVARF